jgi:hypothetical protein
VSADADLTLLLKRSLELGPAAVEAGASLTKQARAAKKLAADHAAVLSAQTVTGRRRMEPSPDAERAELRALRKWFVTSAASLGMATGPNGEDE